MGDNLSRALIMAGSALLFVFALTTSVYLYGSLNTYLASATEKTGMTNRVESSVQSDASLKREITTAEIIITAYNMRRMHVEELQVGSLSITPDDVENNSNAFRQMRNRYFLNTTATYYYDSVGSKAIYTPIG